MAKLTFTVKGMHCNSCKTLVEEGLRDLGATSVMIDLDEKKQVAKVSFEYSGDKKKAIKIIEDEGYKVQ